MPRSDPTPSPLTTPRIDSRERLRKHLKRLTDTTEDVWEYLGPKRCTEVFCLALGLEYGVTDLGDDIPDCRIHWMGIPPGASTPSSKLVLYFPGPCYSLPLLEGHIVFLGGIKMRLRAQGIETTVAFVEHGISRGVDDDGVPTSKHPNEYIEEAIEILRFVVHKQHFSPSNIVIGGDSAGGNTAIALVSILTHSDPGSMLCDLTELLAGVFLISPWVCLSQSFETQSFKDNAEKDILTAEQFEKWTNEFHRNIIGLRNIFTDPVAAPHKWWTPVSKKVTNEILIVAGGDEILLSNIEELAFNMQNSRGPNVLYVECPSEVHIHCMFNGQYGLPMGRMSPNVWDWLESVFKKEPSMIDKPLNHARVASPTADKKPSDVENSVEELAAEILENLLLEVVEEEGETSLPTF